MSNKPYNPLVLLAKEREMTLPELCRWLYSEYGGYERAVKFLFRDYGIDVTSNSIRSGAKRKADTKRGRKPAIRG